MPAKRSEGRAATAIAALALALLVGLGGTAIAHANYVRSQPDADARLARPPAEVRITFSEPVEPRFSEIQVLDAVRVRVDRGDTRSIDANTLRVGLKEVSDGGYTVAWKVLSTVDGHETSGAFVFAVGDAPLPAVADVAAAPPPSPLEVAGRTLTFGGGALLFGAPLFALAISRAPEERPRLRALARAGAIALLAGTALLLVGRPDAVAILSDSRLGRLYEARAALAAAALVMPALPALLAIGASVAATLTLQSHAAATGDVFQSAVDLVHAFAASAWAGGLASLAIVALPRRRAPSASGGLSLGDLAWRFSVLGLVSVGALVVTGVVQATARLADPLDLVETEYGLALSAKVILLGLALVLAALNLLRHGPRLRAARDVALSARFLTLGVRGEVALVAGILLAAGLLTALAPPSTPVTGASYAEVRHDNGLRLELFTQSRLPGQNRYLLRVREGLSTPRDVEKVALRFTMIEHDMGEQELVAQERVPGEFAATGSTISMFGTWRIQVVVRRAAHEEARAVFTVPVAAPATSGGTTARVLQAGTLTLVVFSNPSLPLAGQPATVTVVVLDAKSDPMSGGRLVGTLEGKSLEGIADVGGRYRLELPALTAGEKTLKLTFASSAGSGEAEYPLSVAP